MSEATVDTPIAEPLTEEQLLDTLLADAKVVALYVQRAGLLSDMALPAAIAEVDRLPVKSWRDPAVVQLQLALNNTMSAIAPTTLQDLKGRNAPFNASFRLEIQGVIFVIVAILMVIAAGGITLSYNKGTALIQSIQKLEDSKAEERLSDIIREIVANAQLPSMQSTPTAPAQGQAESGSIAVSAGETPNPIVAGTASASDVFWRDKPIEAVAAESYMAKLQEARAIDEEIAVSVDLADRFLLANKGLVGFLTPEPIYLTRLSEAVQMPRSGGDEAQAEGSGSQQYDPCTPGAAEPIKTLLAGTEFGATAMSNLIRSHLYHGVVVTCLAQMNYHIFNFPVLGRYADQLRQIVNVYGLWLLPALYGALGASLYHMRRVLNPILPNPSLLRILYRITVSAFAGIVIAWIWAPNGQASQDYQNIGVSLFVVAFLVGYSIDVFFTLLDRLVTNVTGSIGKLGAQQTTTTTTT